MVLQIPHLIPEKRMVVRKKAANEGEHEKTNFVLTYSNEPSAKSSTTWEIKHFGRLKAGRTFLI